MFNKILDFVNKNKLIKENDKIVVGVSGGADSVCLLLVLLEMQKHISFDVLVVHINHGIRGVAADDDERFVKELCGLRGVPFKTSFFDVNLLAKQKGRSIEEMGRIVRYDYFNKVMQENKYNKIAVAHNANDNVETILYHFFRGSGILGLTGMSESSGNIIRPLIQCKREEIESYLEALDQDYRTDASNFSEEYTRNKIRLKLIPYIEEYINCKSGDHILDTSRQLLEINQYLESQANQIYDQIVINERDKIRLPKAFMQESAAIRKVIVRRAISQLAGKLKDITSVHIESIDNLCNKAVGKRIQLPYGIIAVKEYEGLCLAKGTEPAEIKQNIQKMTINPVFDTDKVYDLGNKGKIKVRLESTQNWTDVKQMDLIATPQESMNEKKWIIHEKIYTKWLDYDNIEDTLIIRGRRQGDWIQINHTGSKKKLKDYYIDMKIPASQRDQIPLLADGSQIMWVIGYRISEKYKVTEDTKTVLRIELVRDNNG